MTGSVLDGGGSLDYQRVALLCERVGTLPPLPHAALALIQALDDGVESIANLEDVISRDIGLTTEVLRVASEHLAHDAGHLSLRRAIATLGFSSVRSVGLSMALHGAIAQDTDFRPLRNRISTCGSFVGQASRFMFARLGPEEQRGTGLSADEVYAMGILCNLGVSLLAKLDPELLTQTIDYARTTEQTVHAAFFNLHGRPIDELGVIAAKAWDLPDAFVSGQSHLARPSARTDETPAWSCITLAREIAELQGVGLSDWPVAPGSVQHAGAEVGIAPQEIEILVDLLKIRLDAARLERRMKNDEDEGTGGETPQPDEGRARADEESSDPRGTPRQLPLASCRGDREVDKVAREADPLRLKPEPEANRAKRPHWADEQAGIEEPRNAWAASLKARFGRGRSTVHPEGVGTPKKGRAASRPDAVETSKRRDDSSATARTKIYWREPARRFKGSSRESLTREIVSLVRDRKGSFDLQSEPKAAKAPAKTPTIARSFLGGALPTLGHVLNQVKAGLVKALEW